MDSFRKRLTSRKFLSMLGGVLIAAGSMFAGTVPAQTGLVTIAGLVIAYILAEGYADGQGGGKPQP